MVEGHVEVVSVTYTADALRIKSFKFGHKFLGQFLHATGASVVVRMETVILEYWVFSLCVLGRHFLLVLWEPSLRSVKGNCNIH